MPALSDLPELVGFFSYSRDDDEDSDSRDLSQLRLRIQNELRGQLGRSRETLRLWQDQEAIAPGALWESQLEAAVKQSVFFIPIITPRVVFSKYCNLELERFLAREQELGRNDLIFPILYIDVIELHDETVWRAHPVLKDIGARQYVDWREHRLDPNSVAVRRAIAGFCSKVVVSLRSRPTEQRPASGTKPDAPRDMEAPPSQPSPEQTLLKAYDVETLEPGRRHEESPRTEPVMPPPLVEAERAPELDEALLRQAAPERDDVKKVDADAEAKSKVPGSVLYAAIAVFAISLLNPLYVILFDTSHASPAFYASICVEILVILLLSVTIAGRVYKNAVVLLGISALIDAYFLSRNISILFSSRNVPMRFYLVLFLEIARVASVAIVARGLLASGRAPDGGSVSETPTTI